MSDDNKQLWGYAAAAGTVAIWSGFILISRLGGKSVLTPYDVLALRMGTAALLLLPFAGGLPRGAWRDVRLWTLALFGGLFYGVLVYSGFKHAPAAHAAILLPGLQPFLIAGVAWMISRESARRVNAAGLLAIAVGVLFAMVPYFMGSGGHWSVAMLGGDALFLGASLVWAVYTVLAKRWNYNPWVLTRFVAFASALAYVPVYLLWLPKQISAAPTSTLIVQGLYQGIGPTIVAMLLFLKAVSVLGAERTGAVIALVPVLAGVAAAPLLDEPLTLWLVLALGFVSLGAYLAARPAKLPMRTKTCPT